MGSNPTLSAKISGKSLNEGAYLVELRVVPYFVP
ncbi:hypothetical protein BN1263440044 [Stenotrophomonas indicatrix]|nr:hypothetical protein BN1263440044 [Stenotrophomonas indicatrix]